MNFTDQEIVILRAMNRLKAPGGLILIADIIRSVNYPKATVKKVLLQLSGKGVVALHRHDFPQSLTPAQRKLMIALPGGRRRIGGGSDYQYFHAAVVRDVSLLPKEARNNPMKRASKKRNPRGQHIAGGSRKQQRAYTKILGSIKASGKYRGRQKEVAARTARATVNTSRRKNKTIIKRAKRVIVLNRVLRLNPANEDVKFYRDLRAKAKKHADTLQKAWRETAAAMDKEGNTQRGLSGEELKQSQARFKVLRDKLYAIEERLGPARQEYERLANKVDEVKGRKNPRRRRNSEKRDSDHPIEVTKHWRAGPPGYLTPWQRAHHAGQRQLFDTGIKPAAKRNPKKAKRRNAATSKVKSLFQKFSGKKARREVTVMAAKNAPAKVSKLGRLRKIRLKSGQWYEFDGSKAPYLAADSRHKLHIVGGKYRANPSSTDMGEIDKVVYEAAKPHLGKAHAKSGPYVHSFGEEGGSRPHLRIDGEGLMHITGGSYTIEAEGIRD